MAVLKKWAVIMNNGGTFCILEIIQYAVKILYECRKGEAMMETWELVELPEELELDDEMFDFACCGCACGGGGK